MKNSIKSLILSGFLALNLMGSAPAPVQSKEHIEAGLAVQPGIELTSDEIEMLKSEDVIDHEVAVKIITDRGIDVASLDSYLSHDHRFTQVYNRVFRSLYPAIDTLNLPLFEHVLAHHPDAINKMDDKGNRPLNIVLSKIRFHLGEATLPPLRTMVKLLINHGADKESPYLIQHCGDTYDIGTPLLQAIDTAEYDLIAFLLAHGANLNAINHRGHTAIEMAKAMRNNNPQEYDKIIAFLEHYKQSRLENRILQQGLAQKGIRPEIAALITEYAPASQAVLPTQGLRPYIPAPAGSAKRAHAQRVALNGVKIGLKNNDLEPLNDFMQVYPKSLNAHDEAGDSLLLLAIKTNNVAAVKLILEKLTQLDQTENSVNERLTKALGHRNLYDNNAYDIAQEMKNKEIIELLKPHYNAPEMAPQ